MLLRRAALLCLSVALVACGDSGDDDGSPVNQLVVVDDEPAGENCRDGGLRIRSGGDANRNGTLEEGEVGTTSYACNREDCNLNENGNCVGAQLRGALIGDPGTVTVFNGTNLAGADLRNTIFADIVLSDASFEGADLSGARVLGDVYGAGVNFRNANFTDAQFGGEFYASDFSGANFARASVNMYCEECVAIGATFDGARIGALAGEGSDYSGSSFVDAILTGVEFEQNTVLDGSNFTHASLRGTDFSLTSAGGVTYTDAIYSTVSPVTVWSTTTPSDAHEVGPSANLAGLDLHGMDFQGHDLSSANFAGANLTGALFDNADLSSATLSGVDATKATFQGADLTSAVLAASGSAGPATFMQVDLQGATLSGANFTGVDLTGANLSGVVVNGGTFFTNANVTRATFLGVSFAVLGAAPSSWTGAYYNDDPLGPFSATDWGVVNSGNPPSGTVNVDNLTAGGQYQYLWFPGDDFERGDLSGANFSDAHLGGLFRFADLSGVNFTNAVLTGLEMRGADFGGANLTGANLDGSFYAGSNFDGATFGNTTCADGRNSDTNEGTCVGIQNINTSYESLYSI